MTKFPFTMRVISCAVIAASVSPAANAMGFTFSPKIQAQLGFEDNVFRLADQESAEEIIGTDDRDDLIIDVGAGFVSEYESNNQKFELEAKAFRREYLDFDVLSFTGGEIDAKWNIALNSQWHADLGYNFTRDQSSFSEENLAQGDLFDQNRLYFELTNRYGKNNDVFFRASFQSKDYEVREQLENDTYDFTAGVRRTSSLGNTLSFELTRAEGDYPNRLDFSAFGESLQDYSQDQATVRVDWKTGTRSTLKASVGFVNREHNDELSELDFQGVVYDFRWKWEISQRTEFNAQYAKQLRDTENLLTVFNEEERLSASLKYNLTNKLLLTSGISLQDIDFERINENRDDTATIFEAGVQYDLDKKSTVGLTFKSRTRTSNEEFSEFDSSLTLLSFERIL